MYKKFFALITLLFIFAFPINALANERQITAQLEGMNELYVGVPVEARVTFTLQHGVYEEEITPSDFSVWRLPGGLRAEEAERISDTIVEVRITGTPTWHSTNNPDLQVTRWISARNFPRRLSGFVEVITANLSVPDVIRSAEVSPHHFTFDINPHGWQHRNPTIWLTPREFTFTQVRYGSVILSADVDYIRFENNDNRFEIDSSFLSRLPVGEWDLTFRMSQGSHPTVSMTIIDTSVTTVTPPTGPLGPPPAPPMPPVHPDENFMFLTGGVAVNMNDLHWDINRARVNPSVFDGVAQVVVRAHVLDNLSAMHPNTTFEISTPMARVKIPTNLLDIIFAGRFEILRRELAYNQVDVRITIADRSDDALLTHMFRRTYPRGEILSPLVDLTVELVHVPTGIVIHTAREFSRPISMSFVVMDNAGHLRPAGILFQRAWMEFAPYRSPAPNEITINSIFPGVHAVVHNGVFFEDVYTRHWGFSQAYTAGYSGIVLPMDNLHPETIISRGEFAQLLAFALQLPRQEANFSGFVDVLPSNVFFDGVSRLFRAGYLGPHIVGSQFYPNAPITREEIAAISGMALITGTPERLPVNRPLSFAFTDAHEFNPRHLTNIQVTVNYGVMVGYPDNTFRPKEHATRVYALQTIMRLSRTLGVIDEA
jgi:hypothetical protein